MREWHKKKPKEKKRKRRQILFFKERGIVPLLFKNDD